MPKAKQGSPSEKTVSWLDKAAVEAIAEIDRIYKDAQTAIDNTLSRNSTSAPDAVPSESSE